MTTTDQPLTHTPWRENIDMPTYPSLKEDRAYDVCIIGGGVAGLTTAYLLINKGMKVCVLEGQNIGEGQTGLSTAHITSVLDKRYYKIVETHGIEAARTVADSHVVAMHKIEEIINTENFDCDFKKVNGFLCTSSEPNDREMMEVELKTLHDVGLKNVYRMSHSPIETFSRGPCLNFPNQMQFNPLKYLKELAKYIVSHGGEVFCQTHVKELQASKEINVYTSNGPKVAATSVVVATNSPINNTFAVHTKQAPYRTYAIAIKIPKGRVPHGLYWNTDTPYHYLRADSLDEISDTLIVGGEDHKTGQNDKPETSFERLRVWTKKRFPFIGETLHKWSGQIMEPCDGLPYLGHNPMDNKNIYVITGHSGVGIAQSTIGAMIITDQIMFIKNPWEKVYDPSRISVRAIGDYIKENANVAAQYADWLSAKTLDSLDDLKHGQGIVVNHGLKKVAIYRSMDGNLETLSAACPHLGGVVHWNSVEMSWDCPCHGSRFNCSGKVIEGPAAQDLQVLTDVIKDGGFTDLAKKQPPDAIQIYPRFFGF